jgi:hypothetical protein
MTSLTPSSSAAAPMAEAKLALPSTNVMNHAMKLAIMDDRPIMMDYWKDSIAKSVFIGVNPNQEKMIVRNESEYTSPISKIYRVEGAFIILTENSLYIVEAGIKQREISM